MTDAPLPNPAPALADPLAVLQRVRLFTPGPCMVPEDVLCEMARPQEHHRTQRFVQIFKECCAGLRYVFQTRGDVVTVTGSGTAAMECAMGGLCPTGDPARITLAYDNGKFGERWVKTCKSLGIPYEGVVLPWGTGPTAEDVAARLKAHPGCAAVVLCHSETSTATACDVKAIAQVTRESGALLIVDGITAVGALPFEMDAWGVDVAICGSQKAFMLPPGLGFIALGPRALERAKTQKPTPGLYLSLPAYLKGLADADVPYTPNNQLLLGLHRVLRHFQAVGMQAVWAKTALLAKAVRAAGVALGMPPYSQFPSDSVTALLVPAGVDEKKLRSTMRSRHGIQLAAGQNELEGKVIRANHMGYVDAYDTLGLVGALELTLTSLGHSFPPGAGLTAAMRVLSEG